MNPADDLDTMLRGWAASMRLTDAETAAMRQAIMRSGAAPSASWWRDFHLRVGDVMVRANRAGRLVSTVPAGT